MGFNRNKNEQTRPTGKEVEADFLHVEEAVVLGGGWLNR